MQVDNNDVEALPVDLVSKKKKKQQKMFWNTLNFTYLGVQYGIFL